MSEERFTSSQAEQLLRRAAELQARQRGDDGEPTLSMADLERLAAEAGISPAFVHKAALVAPTRREVGPMGWSETFEADVRAPMPAVQDAMARSALTIGGQAFTMMQGPSVTRMIVRRRSVHATLEAQAGPGAAKIWLRQSPFTAYFYGMHGPLLVALIGGINLIAQGFLAWGLVCAVAFTVLGFVLMNYFSKVGRRQAAELWEQMMAELSNGQKAPAVEQGGVSKGQDNDDDLRQNLQT